MARNSSRPAPRTALTLLILCVAGVLLAPVAVYLFGSTVMGPYEGDGGFMRFAGSVFSAAAGGRPGALALLLTPAGLVLTWWLIFRLLRRRPANVEPTENNS